MDVEKIRQEIPAIRNMDVDNPFIYFDNASETLIPQPVYDSLLEYYSTPGNSWSGHRYSIQVMLKCKRSRENVASLINARSPGEIIWTKNATEGINLISRTIDFQPHDTVMITDKEHNANIVPWHNLKEKGVDLKIIRSKDDLTFDFGAFEDQMNDKVRLVSMALTSIIDGYTIPAKEIIKTAHDHGASVLLDAVQTVPHQPVDVQALDTDFLVFSPQNMFGPNGIGILYGKEDKLKELHPFLGGGGTVDQTTYEHSEYQNPPAKFEAGNLNYSGIIGTGNAVDYLKNIGYDDLISHEKNLNRKLTEGLSKFDNIEILGQRENKQRIGMFNFNIKGFNPHDVAIHLEEESNILTRSGALCAHPWFLERKSNGAVSVLCYAYNTEEEVEKLIVTIEDLMKELD